MSSLVTRPAAKSKIILPQRVASRGREAEQSALSLLSLCKALSHLYQLQAQMLKLGLQFNALVLTKFASTSSFLGAVDHAFSFLFDSDSNSHLSYDAFLFNTVMRSYAQTQRSKVGTVKTYRLMLAWGVRPNKFTYPFVLKEAAGLGELKLGQQLHCSLLKFGFSGDVHVDNTLVHMYGCSDGGMSEAARNVFDNMPKRDSVSWSAMIGGYVKMGRPLDAIELFRKMQVCGVQPDEVTMISVLSACSELGALELGKWVESYIEKHKIQKGVEVFNALIDMFAKCGDVHRASWLFRSMAEKDRVSWTSLIVGLAMHGRGVEAISLFEEMIASGIQPDDVLFIGLLTACSHAGLIEEGRRYFYSMADYDILPRIEHYGCMVDLHCRIGRVKEALDFVATMPIEPNPVIWRTLVSACHATGNLELGESITRRLIGDEPLRDSNYVLLSNIYAKMASWDRKYSVRGAMCKRGVKKTPRSTLVELDNKIYEFVAGDKTQEEVYQMLDEMSREMRRAGYVPVTSEVLLDIDEGDKEDALNQHSEKVAVAFAILKTPPGFPIRLVKNLRVCSDCHVAFKFIANIYNREIVMRDRNRFHHFKDGICSCRDFW